MAQMRGRWKKTEKQKETAGERWTLREFKVEF